MERGAYVISRVRFFGLTKSRPLDLESLVVVPLLLDLIGSWDGRTLRDLSPNLS